MDARMTPTACLKTRVRFRGLEWRIKTTIEPCGADTALRPLTLRPWPRECSILGTCLARCPTRLAQHCFCMASGGFFAGGFVLPALHQTPPNPALHWTLASEACSGQ